ncbi:MAG: YwqJ-related putative deaminase, partial [Anaerovoracaceae bacterium]
SLTYSQKQKIRLYYEGTSSKIKFSNTDPALDSLAKLIAFSQVNCANRWDAACESKWLQKNQRDARNAAILIGAVFAPAVVAASPEAITAIGAGASTVGTRALHCIMNMACNTQATVYLDGLVTGGMASGGIAVVGSSTVKYTANEVRTASKLFKTLSPAAKTAGQTIFNKEFLATKRLSAIVEADAAKILAKASQYSNRAKDKYLALQVAVARAIYQGKVFKTWTNIVFKDPSKAIKNRNYSDASFITNNSVLEIYDDAGHVIKQFNNFAKWVSKDETYQITNPTLYISYIKYLYQMHPQQPILNAKMEQAILAYLKTNPVIPQRAGLPGLHAEVLATNEVLNTIPNAQLKDIVAATYKVQKGDGQGAAFPACQNCCGILVNVVLLTGETNGNIPACSF